ncbi:MAG: hypothetical protein PHO48_02555 [Candidatus Gracilibacteria bacterium]|nr:hypothetical protein [Candidatus Gracilibacteria bacterium]MDD5179418.1 hypothetical protein [Candidatus Gracilibacteria bacterium]
MNTNQFEFWGERNKDSGKPKEGLLLIEPTRNQVVAATQHEIPLREKDADEPAKVVSDFYQG